MKLTLKERFDVITLFPTQSDFITLQRIEEARKVLLPSEQEVKDYEVTNTDKGLTWKNDSEREVVLGETATDLVIKELKRLNDAKELKIEHLSLYGKFVESKKDEVNEKGALEAAAPEVADASSPVEPSVE